MRFFLPQVTSFWALALVLCSFSFFWDAILAQFDAVTFEHLGERGRVWYPRIRGLGSAGFVVLAIASGYWFDRFPIEHWPYWVLGLAGALALMSFTVPGRAVESHESPPDTGFFDHANVAGGQCFPDQCFFDQDFDCAAECVFHALCHGCWALTIGAGWLWALGVIVEVIILVFFSTVLARFDPRWLMMTALAVACLRWPMIALGIESLGLMLFAAALHGITFGVFHAGAMEFLRQQFPRQQLGRGIALYSTLGFGLANALGAPVSGVLYEIGGGRLAFGVATGVVAIGAMLMAWQIRSSRVQ